uniref:Palmitoyltransferase n=1 Tax=Schistosoma mansoni TaxID=6183 RepID=A0A5K4FA91_SCHMA
MSKLRQSCLRSLRGIRSVYYLLANAIPKSRVVRNVLVRSILAIFSSYLLFLELYFVLPYLLEEEKYLAYGILLFIYTCFCSSVTLCIYKDPSIRNLLLSSKSRPDWTYCLTCQTLRPPRAHHCFDCAICVLRRDHHCTILGQCIGHANWRYFCNTLLYGLLGCAFMTYYHLTLVFHSDYFPITWSIYYKLLCMITPPGFMWLLGYLTFIQSILFLTTCLLTLITCLLFVFIIYEFNLMVTNQTMYERTFKSFDQCYWSSSHDDDDHHTTGMKRFREEMNSSTGSSSSGSTAISTSVLHHRRQQSLSNHYSSLYDIGYQNNIKQYLGEHWILAILCPFIHSPLTTDGLSYPISDSVKFK